MFRIVDWSFIFSTNSQLELFQVNLADRSMSMSPIAAIKTDYRFVRSFAGWHDEEIFISIRLVSTNWFGQRERFWSVQRKRVESTSSIRWLNRSAKNWISIAAVFTRSIWTFYSRIYSPVVERIRNWWFGIWMTLNSRWFRAEHHRAAIIWMKMCNVSRGIDRNLTFLARRWEAKLWSGIWSRVTSRFSKSAIRPIECGRIDWFGIRTSPVNCA